VLLDVGPILRALRRQPGVIALVVLEVAVAFTMITSLLLAGYWYEDLSDQHSGLDEDNLIDVLVHTAAASSAPDPEGALRASQAADEQRIRATAGVVAAAAASLTFVDERWNYPTLFHARDRRTAAAGGEAFGWLVQGDVDLPAVMGLRFGSGAAPDRRSVERSGGAAVITRCLAERLFGTATPPLAAGEGVMLSSEQSLPVPLVGVVDDVLVRVSFLPFPQCAAFLLLAPAARPFGHQSRLLVRVAPGQRSAVMARLVSVLAPAPGETPASAGSAGRFVQVKPVDPTRTITHRIGHGLVAFMSMFGGLLAVMALLGAFAATSFLVAQRTRQIGVRRALGATRGDIVGYFLLESWLGTGLGVLLGLAGTAVFFRVMQGVFPAIRLQPGIIIFTVLLMLAASVLATLVPALRAARVPPSVAARSL
jgi:putative ABC transport system permease protein